MGQNCVGHRFLSCEQVLVCLTPASEDVSPLLDPSLPLCPPCPPAATSPPLPCILTLLSPCCQPGPNVPNEANWNPSFSVPFDFSPCWTFQLWDSFCGRFFHLAARFCRNHTDSIAQDFKSIVFSRFHRMGFQIPFDKSSPRYLPILTDSIATTQDF